MWFLRFPILRAERSVQDQMFSLSCCLHKKKKKKKKKKRGSNLQMQTALTNLKYDDVLLTK